MSAVRIFEIEDTADVFVCAINKLLSQLSSTPRSFTLEQLRAIVSSPSSHLFVAEGSAGICGMLTVGEYISPTGRKMWIEDVVVDEAMRGKSVGRALVEFAMEYAASTGGGVLMLTSRPSRVAANALYRSCGFEPKETNMYRIAVEE